tara:strand:+ start:733 stop:1323 length:591 start_codon:yes stop_codon:yes gene_type:complete
VHIPKTGGTSIECVFENNASEEDVKYKHHTLSEYEGLNKPILNTYFKFAFVRNPWDMTTSMYNYLWHRDHPWSETWRRTNKNFSKLSFREWITHRSFREPTIRSIDVNSIQGGRDGDFSSWLTSKKYTIDFIGRFENLQNDFDIICDKIGIPQKQLPHKNKSNHKHYTEYYDDETRKIVAEKYAEDIKCFGYTFGE